MKENAKSHKKLKRILTFPMRMLGKARDLYVDAINSYAGAGFGLPMADPLPRSFSATSHRSSDVDYKELIRAASARTYAEKLDLNALNPGPQSTANTYAAMAVKRSSSVNMAKIEEDKPCEIGVDEIRNVRRSGDDDYKKKNRKGIGLFSRSKSYAVSSTTSNRFDR